MPAIRSSYHGTLTCIKPIEPKKRHYVQLSWFHQLLRVKTDLGHAHLTRFWYLLGALFKISDKHPCHFHRGVPPGSLSQDLNRLTRGILHVLPPKRENKISTRKICMYRKVYIVPKWLESSTVPGRYYSALITWIVQSMTSGILAEECVNSNLPLHHLHHLAQLALAHPTISNKFKICWNSTGRGGRRAFFSRKTFRARTKIADPEPSRNIQQNRRSTLASCRPLLKAHVQISLVL